MPSISLLLLASIVALLFPATDAVSRASLRRLESKFAQARQRDICVASRAAAISAANDKLSAAITCRRNGLTPSAFAAALAICRRRKSVRRVLSKCSKHCASARAALHAAEDACTAIGRERKGDRPICSNISKLKQELAAARAIKCRKGLSSTARLASAFKAAAEKRRKQLALPPSAYDLTALEPLSAVADAAVIVVNGLAETVADILPLVKVTQSLGTSKIRFIIPQAPTIFVDEFDAPFPAWYNVPAKPGEPPSAEEVLNATANIDAIAELQRKVHGIAPERVLIFGVSQGASVALTLYLRYKVGALVSVSGFLLLGDTYPAALTQDSSTAPALIYHGSADTRVPIEVGRASRDALIALGRNVTFVKFEGGMHRLQRFLGQLLQGTARFYDDVLG